MMGKTDFDDDFMDAIWDYIFCLSYELRLILLFFFTQFVGYRMDPLCVKYLKKGMVILFHFFPYYYITSHSKC